MVYSGRVPWLSVKDVLWCPSCLEVTEEILVWRHVALCKLNRGPSCENGLAPYIVAYCRRCMYNEIYFYEAFVEEPQMRGQGRRAAEEVEGDGE